LFASFVWFAVEKAVFGGRQEVGRGEELPFVRYFWNIHGFQSVYIGDAPPAATVAAGAARDVVPAAGISPLRTQGRGTAVRLMGRMPVPRKNTGKMPVVLMGGTPMLRREIYYYSHDFSVLSCQGFWAGAFVRNKANFGGSEIEAKPFTGKELCGVGPPCRFKKTKPIWGRELQV